jgi:hypothetical protein
MRLGLVIQNLGVRVTKSSTSANGDSKLIRILENSLGGKANTAIIVTVTPAPDSTLGFGFANHAKAPITTHAQVK